MCLSAIHEHSKNRRQQADDAYATVSVSLRAWTGRLGQFVSGQNVALDRATKARNTQREGVTGMMRSVITGSRPSHLIHALAERLFAFVAE